MSSFRLDGTAFKAQTAEKAVQSHAEYYKTLTLQERMHIADYLNCSAYNYPENEPPGMDKKVFSIISRK